MEELRSYLLGWKVYFRLADTPGVFRSLDQWIARRLRMLKLKQWKRGRTAYREMRTLRVPEWLARKAAHFTRSWWRVSGHGALHTALPGRLFEQMGLPALAPH